MNLETARTGRLGGVTGPAGAGYILLMTEPSDIALALVVACAACGGERLLRSPLDPLRLDVVAARTTIDVGDTTTVRFQLTNAGGDTVRLTFSSGCQVLPYVTDTDHRVVYPGGGGWFCTTVITYLELAPGAQQVVPLVIHGGSPAAPGYANVPLDPGQYWMYATLEQPDHPRSESLLFTVR